MPWTTPRSSAQDQPQAPDALTLRINRERQQIREAVPVGWAHHHNLLTYGVQPSNHLYGVCAHNRVCLLDNEGRWRHPYPVEPLCDDPPRMTHGNIL